MIIRCLSCSDVVKTQIPLKPTPRPSPEVSIRPSRQKKFRPAQWNRSRPPKRSKNINYKFSETFRLPSLPHDQNIYYMQYLTSPGTPINLIILMKRVISTNYFLKFATCLIRNVPMVGLMIFKVEGVINGIFLISTTNFIV